MKAVRAWLRASGGPQTFYLAGFAGTGKTTLAKLLAGDIGNVVYAAFTGKAALVLESKGCSPSSTIHSLIYKIKDHNSPIPEFIIDRDSEARFADLIIIDEVSMVGDDLGRDLLSFGTKILVLGDPAQLPPVQSEREKETGKGQGFFTRHDPDVMLTEVHRQAADNPIIKMSMIIREGGKLELGTYGESKVITKADLDATQVLAADQVIVGLNKSRRLYNGRIRNLKGYKGRFVVGERIVTLKNNKEKGILNGGLWDVTKIVRSDADVTSLHAMPVDVGMSQEHAVIRTHHAWLDGKENNLNWKFKLQFSPADYGYVLSCHKAQGSQWNDTLIFDESASFRDNARQWLYTAITRAAIRTTVVV